MKEDKQLHPAFPALLPQKAQLHGEPKAQKQTSSGKSIHSERTGILGRSHCLQ